MVRVGCKGYGHFAYIKGDFLRLDLQIYKDVIVVAEHEVLAFKFVHDKLQRVFHHSNRIAGGVRVHIGKSVRKLLYHFAALYQYGVVADNIGPIDVEIFIYLLHIRYIGGQSVAVDDGHILIFALVYVEDKLRLVYGHKRIGHVGDQRSRSVVVGVTIEDDHGEVEARVRCGGSTAYVGEGKAGIGLRIICKPSDNVVFFGIHKGVHHFGYLSLLSQSRFRVFCRDGQIHYQAVFCRDVGSSPAVQLKRDVIVGDGVAIHIVSQVVLGLLKPDGGVSLIYGYLDNL